VTIHQLPAHAARGRGCRQERDAMTSSQSSRTAAQNPLQGQPAANRPGQAVDHPTAEHPSWTQRTESLPRQPARSPTGPAQAPDRIPQPSDRRQPGELGSHNGGLPTSSPPPGYVRSTFFDPGRPERPPQPPTTTPPSAPWQPPRQPALPVRDGGPRHLRSGEQQRFEQPAEPAHPLADDYYRLSHKAYGGGQLIDRGVLDVGLAAALIGELLHGEHIAFENGMIIPLRSHPARSAATMAILEHIRAETDPLPVVDWLRFVATSAYDDVAQRLLLGRHVVAYDVGRIRKRRVYEPVNVNAWEWVRIDIANRINSGRPLTYHQLFLAGLAYVTNLLNLVMGHMSGADEVPDLLTNLPPADQALLQVIYQTVADLARL
jgi:hypothetical protein